MRAAFPSLVEEALATETGAVSVKEGYVEALATGRRPTVRRPSSSPPPRLDLGGWLLYPPP